MRGPEGASVQQCTEATRQPAGVFAEVHQQVPCLLHGPRAVGVRGHAEDMDVAGADLEREEHVDAPQG